jgi:Protein of unknown function (DUF3592)
VNNYLFGAAAVMLVGLGLTGYGVVKYLALRDRLRETAHWLSVQGRVYASRVVQEESYSPGGDIGDPGQRTTVYLPEVRFEYRVADREYAAKQVQVGDPVQLSWPDAAERIVRSYPVGRDVTVYYDPADPNRAVLERKVASGSALLLGIAGIGLLVAVIAVVNAFRAA